MPHRFQNALATVLIAALAGAGVSGRQPTEITQPSLAQLSLASHQQVVAIDGVPPITVTLLSNGNAEAIARLGGATQRALRAFVEWLGAPQRTDLTVVDLPWAVGTPGAAYAGLIETRMRLLAPARDLIAERSLIAALAREFWLPAGDGDPFFREGLVIYTATRGIHTVLEGQNFAAPRFFGGFVPMPIRSLVLSPNLAGPRPLLGEFDEVLLPSDAPWRFAPAGEGTPARRASDALRTLERIIGWPAMQQALAALRAGTPGRTLTPEAFADVLAAQRGISMQWFVRDLLRSADPIDYAVGEFHSVESGGNVQTAITIERRGAGVFAGTDHPRSAGPARSFQVLARFADSSEARAFIDGRDQRTELLFNSGTAAISATLDPDELVLIDADRTNNGRLLTGPRVDRMGLRLVLNWVVWLQNAMLTYTAIA